MLRRPSKGWIWLLLPVSIAAFFLGATFFFYRGSYSPPGVIGVPVEEITLPSYAARLTADAPVNREGVLVLDNSHANAFDVQELNSLFFRVTNRGYRVEFVLSKERSAGGISSDGRLAFLEQRLRGANSFGVVLPTIPFTPEEAVVVQSFVEKGGKVLLIGDPTRSHQLDSLADRFGILFQEGYLYNVVDHDLNFRNIFVRHFRPDQVTEGLGTIALYTAGSVKSTGPALAFADTNTSSSMVERVGPFAPLAKSADGRVLAISDLTFLRPPENSAQDNDRLISNIADFLTTGERRFDLADFPHFFEGGVDILLGRADIFETGARLRDVLLDFQIASDIRAVEDQTRDAVYLGLYEDKLGVSQYLDIDGVQVGDAIRTPFTPDIGTEGTAFVLLHEGQSRRVLVILGESPAPLDRA